MQKDSNEGACGRVVATSDPSVVLKQIWKRATAHRRTKSHRGKAQCQIQTWAHGICCPENGFSILHVPRAWDADEHEYKMERIDVSKQILPEDFTKNDRLMNDLKLLYSFGFRDGYYACDFELYEQPDGSIAMVDFDKFAWWQRNGSVAFPWGIMWDRETALRLIPVEVETTYF